jgi:uncharacterized phage infection (PIP) family protein YhgE
MVFLGFFLMFNISSLSSGYPYSTLEMMGHFILGGIIIVLVSMGFILFLHSLNLIFKNISDDDQGGSEE